MLSTLKNAIKIKDVQKRILYTFGILIIFQIGIHIPMPGIDASKLASLQNNPLFSMLNLTSGGAMASFGLLALGASPYITASIVIQLLSQGIFPKYTLFSKQGRVGQQKLATRTRFLTLIFGFFQAITLMSTLEYLQTLGFAPSFNFTTKMLMCLVLGMTSLFVAYLGEMINENGIGNGLSLIIASGILVNVPSTIKQWISDYFINTKISINSFIDMAIIIIIVIALMVFTVYINSAECRIPLQSMQSPNQTKAHYLPIKLMAGSVIPVIFASSIISIGSMITTATGKTYSFLNYNTLEGGAVYAVMILLFAYFYNVAQINPDKVAESLEKSSMYIKGIPQSENVSFIGKTVIRLTNIGAPALVFIVMIPIIITNTTNISTLNGVSGTGLLIVVGVFTELYSQINGLAAKHQYPHIL